MGAFEIIGGKQLKGEITPQGAKNEALQIISATLLTSDKITINNNVEGEFYTFDQSNKELKMEAFTPYGYFSAIRFL